MDPKQDKPKPIRKGAHYPADDNKSRTEGKRDEGSDKWFSDNYGGFGEPAKPIYEEPESYVSKPAASAKNESEK
jgi:hypothetical protein